MRMLLVAVVLAVSPASASAATCPAGTTTVPVHLGKGATTVGAAAKGKTRCAAPGSAMAARAQLAGKQHDLVAHKVRELRAKKVRSAWVKASADLDRSVASHVITRQSGVEGQPFVVHDGNTVVSGTETITPPADTNAGDGTDVVKATSTTKTGKVTVQVTETVVRTSQADSCPSEAGLVHGEVEVTVHKVTRTAKGDGPATVETSDDERTTSFTAEVDDAAQIFDVIIERDDKGDSTSKLDWDGPSTRTSAGHETHTTLTATGDYVKGGSPSGTAQANSSSRHAGGAHALDALNDAAAGDAAGEDGRSEVAGPLAKAEKHWQTPNACAVAEYTGDGQTVHKGGTAKVTAKIGKRVTVARLEGPVARGLFTVTDTCGTTVDRASDVSLGIPASFTETDGAGTWVAPRKEGCISLRGTSKVGVVEKTLHFPIANAASFVVTVTGSEKYDYTESGESHHSDGTASACDTSSSGSGSLELSFTSDPNVPTTAMLGDDAHSLSFSQGVDSDGTSTLTGASHSEHHGDGCGDGSDDSATSGCGSRTDGMAPNFRTNGDALHFKLDYPSSDRADCPYADYPDSSNPVEVDPTVPIPWDQLADPSRKTVVVHFSASDSGDENCDDNQGQGCGNTDSFTQTYDLSGTQTDDFTVTFTRQE